MRGVRARLLVALAVTVALLGMLGPNVPVPAATAQAGLFTDAARPPAADAALADRTIVRSRYVDVNLGLMDGTRPWSLHAAGPRRRADAQPV